MNFSAPTRSWLIGLGGVAILIVLFLVFGEKPWEAEATIAERAEIGRKPRVENFMAIGFWWAAVANLVLVLLLMAGVKWWSLQPAPESDDLSTAIPKTSPTRWVWIALGVIVIVGGALRWNLARKSLWWDELWCAKFAIAGYYLGSADTPREERRYGEASLKRALWYYSKPTNHGIASFPARLSHLAWRAIARPADAHAINEFALRLPTLLVSLVTIFATGLLGVFWRRPWTGVLAALLLAIHPWHVRYGIDVRGYSYLVLWTVLGCLWLTRIFQPGGNRWRWWILFGVNQFLLVWSFPVAAFAAAGFFGAAVVLILNRWKERPERLTAFSRLIFVNIMAVMLWLPMAAPTIPQARLFLDSDADRHVGHEVSEKYLFEFASNVTTGLPFRWGPKAAEAGLPALFSRTESGAHWIVLGLIGLGLAAGFIAFRKKPRTPLVILSGLIAGALVTLLFFWCYGGYFYPRFLIFILIPMVWLLAAGWRLAFSRIHQRGGWIGTAALTAAFAWLAAPQLKVLSTRPYEPLREVAAVFSAERATGDKLVAVGYGHGVETLPVYFPEIQKAVSKAELQAFIAKARQSDARLLLTFGHETFNRHEVPDGFELIDDPKRFEEIATFSGIQPDFTFRVLEWKKRG